MYKKFIVFTLCTFITFIVIHLSLLMAVDPLSITKFSGLKKEFYVKEMRFQTAGLIRNYDFDSAIIGTSMAENFDAIEANNVLGGQFLNLSLSGSLLEERKVVINFLINQKNIKSLIVSLDGATALQRNKGIPITNWSYLYNDNYIDDLKVYSNTKYFPYLNCHSFFKEQYFSAIFGDCPKYKIRTDINLLTEWYSDPSKNNRFGGIENWINNIKNPQAAYALRKIANAKRRIKEGTIIPVNKRFNLHNFDEVEKNLIPIIQENPQIKFYLFFPPYSLLFYAMDQQSINYQFENYKVYVKEAALEMEKYPNVQLHWFSDQDFISDIKNYKDLTHFHPRFQSQFLEHFRDKKSLINARNYQTKLEDLESKAKNFDVDEIVSTVKK